MALTIASVSRVGSKSSYPGIRLNDSKSSGSRSNCTSRSGSPLSLDNSAKVIPFANACETSNENISRSCCTATELTRRCAQRVAVPA